jgi:hypothetical protein
VQQQLLRSLALRGQEAPQLHFAAERPAGEELGVGFECDRANFRLDLAPAARLVLLRLVRDLELDRGDAGRRVAQGA